MSETSPVDGVIARVDKARQLLAEARDAGQAKQVADIAHAAEVFARRQKLSQDAIDYATAIRVDATAMMGEFLKRVEKAKGGQPYQQKSTGYKPEPVETLADNGISKRESSDAQLLATAREKRPELFEAVRAGKKKISHVRVELRREEKRAEMEAKAVGAPDSPDWRIVTGDCVEVLRSLADRPRLIFADPPYNIGFDYGAGYDDRRDDADYLAWVREWVGLASDRLTPDGSLWVLINDEYAAEYAAILKSAGLTIRNWVIWYETFGVNCPNKFNRTKRHLFYSVKDAARFVFHADAVSRPSDRQLKYDDPRADPAGKLLDDVWTDIPRLVGTAAERVPDFPTQLPLALLRRVVGCCTDPGDLVVDPFNGSGTTGVAAVESGRRYLGVERSEVFAELARLRLKGVRRGEDA